MFNRHSYFAANRVAGYSGFVVYVCNGTHNYWMVPGTFFHDWDNQ